MNLESFLVRLNHIRNSEWNPHGCKMAAIGYVGAHYELNLINDQEYARAYELMDNAAEYCKRGIKE
jgi:hypothetical protein